MNTSGINPEIPMHVHTCSKCKESMKHYRKGGCSLPEMIVCESCTTVEGIQPMWKIGKGLSITTDEATDGV